MQTLTLHPHRDPDHPGLLYVLARVRLLQSTHFRTLKFSDGTPLATKQAEAERMALEHWPGAMSIRLMLSVGDSGVVEQSPDGGWGDDAGAFEGEPE